MRDGYADHLPDDNDDDEPAGPGRDERRLDHAERTPGGDVLAGQIPQGPAAPCTRLAHEPRDAYALFRAYVALPPHMRKLERVAKATGYAVGTLRNYSSGYEWRERCEECDAVAEMNTAVGQEHARHLMLRRAAWLDDSSETGELIKVGRALATMNPRTPAPVRGLRQPRDGGGRFAADRPAPLREPDPACECATPECRAPIPGCSGGYCVQCLRTKAG